MSRRIVGVVVGMVVVLFFTTMSSGTIYPYGDLTSTTGVSFNGIEEDTGSIVGRLFGAPRRVGNKLFFTPTAAFSSTSSGGAAVDATSGGLKMDVVAPAGAFLEKIIITENGNYQLTGIGTNATQAHVSGSAHIDVIAPEDAYPYFYDQDLSVTPYGGLYKFPTDTSGSFTGRYEFDLTDLGIQWISLNFNNILSATSEAGTTSIIKKNSESESITLEAIVPEPTSLLILCLGGILIKRRMVSF